MLYSYEAKDGGGRTVTGSLEAADERTAASLVHDQGYYLMRLAAEAGRQSGAAGRTDSTQVARQAQSPQAYGQAAVAGAGTAVSETVTLEDRLQERPVDLLTPRPMTLGRWIMERVVLQIWSGVSNRDLAIFYRQFATLLNAGVPLKQSFDALSMQAANGPLRKCMQGIWKYVEAGGSISDGMAQYPWIFRENQRALVVAGELTGGLDIMFRRIADFLEQDYSFRANVKKAMTEPLITFAAVFLLPPLYLVVVQNNLHEYYREAILPLLQICGTVFGIYALGKMISQIRYLSDMFIAFTPVVGPTVRIVALAKFCRTMSTLYAAGVSVPTTVRYAAEACGNAYMAAKMSATVGMMESGYGLVNSLARTRVLPPMVMSMLGVGEVTGSIDVLMDKVAGHFEEEAMLRLHRITVWVRTLATILIGIKVLFVLVHFYQGYFGDTIKSIDTDGN